MKKRIIAAFLGMVVIIIILAVAKTTQIRAMISQAKSYVPPPETVTMAAVKAQSWENTLTAVGSSKAVQGVTVAAELPGKVVKISFASGTEVKQGSLLASQDTTSEEAQLPGAIAQEKLADAELERASVMMKDNVISRSDYDRAVATREQAVSQVNSIRAAIAKKRIRAPFSGRLGIRQANLGQMLDAGNPVVSLQSLDPIYVEFNLPQQQLSRLHTGLAIRVTCDALPGVMVTGRITALNSQVADDTRNIRIQATLPNRDGKFRPGMFVNAEVGLPSRQEVLVIPATSVLYAPYGDSVFLVEEDGNGKGGKKLRQQFIRLGEKRGDFVAVSSGLKEGDKIVSTGAFKLRNSQAVVVDNALAPQFKQSPTPENN